MRLNGTCCTSVSWRQSISSKEEDISEEVITSISRSHTFRHRHLPVNHVWMEDSKLKNVIVCFPEQRNLYNKIFGGFLMRQAFELAWTNMAVFWFA